MFWWAWRFSNNLKDVAEISLEFEYLSPCSYCLEEFLEKAKVLEKSVKIEVSFNCRFIYLNNEKNNSFLSNSDKTKSRISCNFALIYNMGSV